MVVKWLRFITSTGGAAMQGVTSAAGKMVHAIALLPPEDGYWHKSCAPRERASYLTGKGSAPYTIPLCVPFAPAAQCGWRFMPGM